MKALTLTLKQVPRQRIDLSALTPDRLTGLGHEQIGAVMLDCGNRALRTDALFDIAGDDPQELVIENGCDRLDGIGRNMNAGRICVRGDAGAYVGHGMRGGRIDVTGNADIFAACEMAGGLLTVGGDVGDYLGAALPGGQRGMRGGTVLVTGSAGDRVGDRMRRGLVVIEGDAGDYCACRMGAGTIVVLGRVGANAGFAMSRGTLLLHRAPAELLPTFNDCGEHELGFLGLLHSQCKALPTRLATPLSHPTRVRRWVGDLGNGGTGEILIHV